MNASNSPRNLTIWYPLLFALVLIGGILIGMQLSSAVPTVMVESTRKHPTADKQGKVEEVIRYIEAQYVDEVDRDQLIDQAIESILAQLDPHSNYISAEDLRAVNEQLEGNFDGIGVEFMILDDTIVVVAPLAGGPSELAGIRAGDKIVMVEDSLIAGQPMTTRQVIELLRGEKGSEVTVGILRGDDPKLRPFTIVRDEIPIQSVDVAYMLDEKTGYIKLNRFSANTYEEFMKAVEPMVEESEMSNLVIDLRHNPGGYLQQATRILSQLFPDKGELLVYTEGRSVNRNDYVSTGRSYFDLGRVVVLIDEGSASASEILAGAVQDHDRGLIIGRRSFGKGLVQEQYPLRDGSALRLTVARYYTPSGRSIQKPYDDRLAYRDDVRNRLESGELTSAELMEVEDSTTFYTDDGRVVYGGGGIMPDIFVPADTTWLEEEFQQIRGAIPAFVFRHLDEEKSQVIKSAYDAEEFVKRYRPSAADYSQLLAYAREEGASLPANLLPEVRREVKLQLKARMARKLYGDEAFFRVLGEEDLFLMEARKALVNPSRPISSY